MEHRTKWYLGWGVVLGTTTLTGIFYNIDKAAHPVAGRDAATLVSDEVGGVVHAVQNKIAEYEGYSDDYRHFLGYNIAFIGLSLAAILVLLQTWPRSHRGASVDLHPDPWLR